MDINMDNPCHSNHFPTENTSFSQRKKERFKINSGSQTDLASKKAKSKSKDNQLSKKRHRIKSMIPFSA